MGLFEILPYTNYHELNSEWIIKKVQEMQEQMKNFDEFFSELINAEEVAL